MFFSNQFANRADRNIHILEDTLDIFKKRKYEKDGKTIRIKLSRKQMKECHVYLPEDIKKNIEYSLVVNCSSRKTLVSCRNIDSFSAAEELYRDSRVSKILVLNFANPFKPGGGVRAGATAQEEDLCRRSSLLLSLESDAAGEYYRYNLALDSWLSSDAIILTPHVEIIKASDGDLLEEPLVVSVMTCAAPMVREGKEGLSEQQYRDIFYKRICTMLMCAAEWHYDGLVLGAFGCGAFGNDAGVVSDLFYKALKEFRYMGGELRAYFSRIDFAVLDGSADQYNYNEFQRNFGNFYREEDRATSVPIEIIKEAKRENLDKIRGS